MLKYIKFFEMSRVKRQIKKGQDVPSSEMTPIRSTTRPVEVIPPLSTDNPRSIISDETFEQRLESSGSSLADIKSILFSLISNKYHMSNSLSLNAKDKLINKLIKKKDPAFLNALFNIVGEINSEFAEKQFVSNKKNLGLILDSIVEHPNSEFTRRINDNLKNISDTIGPQVTFTPLKDKPPPPPSKVKKFIRTLLTKDIQGRTITKMEQSEIIRNLDDEQYKIYEKLYIDNFKEGNTPAQVKRNIDNSKLIPIAKRLVEEFDDVDDEEQEVPVEPEPVEPEPVEPELVKPEPIEEVKEPPRNTPAGIVDKIINSIGDFVGEVHYPGANYLGPGTVIRRNLKDLTKYPPKDTLDSIAFRHDIYYMSNNAAIRYLADQIFLQEVDKLGLDPASEISKFFINITQGTRSAPSKKDIAASMREFEDLNKIWVDGKAELTRLGYTYPESENTQIFVESDHPEEIKAEFSEKIGRDIDIYDGVISDEVKEPEEKEPPRKEDEQPPIQSSIRDPNDKTVIATFDEQGKSSLHSDNTIDGKPFYTEASTEEIKKAAAPPITEAESEYYDRIGISRPELTYPKITILPDPSNQVIDSNNNESDYLSVYESTNQYGEVDPWRKAEIENERFFDILHRLENLNNNNNVNVYKFLPPIIQQ